MGAGKSSVSRILAQKYPVTDCDAINASLLLEGGKGLVELRKQGLLDNAPLDKKKMAADMFSDASYRKKVEAILHPLIFEEIEDWKQKQSSPLLFVEVPLLFEGGFQNRFDEIWCVVCNEETALQRLEQGRNIAPEQAKARLACQFDVEIKKAGSNYVIDNSGSLQQLEENVWKGVDELKYGI
jgi:dephospho-CoA kinase